MKAENLRKLAAHMRALKPAEYEQDTFARQTPCGTACCVAGHAAQLAGGTLQFEGQEGFRYCDYVTKRGKRVHISDLAQRWLGITARQAERLFTSDPDSGSPEAFGWPGDFGRRYSEAKRKHRVAANLLDALADGKVTL